jgi:hypothetical protein
MAQKGIFFVVKMWKSGGGCGRKKFSAIFCCFEQTKQFNWLCYAAMISIILLILCINSDNEKDTHNKEDFVPPFQLFTMLSISQSLPPLLLLRLHSYARCWWRVNANLISNAFDFACLFSCTIFFHTITILFRGLHELLLLLLQLLMLRWNWEGMNDLCMKKMWIMFGVC